MAKLNCPNCGQIHPSCPPDAVIDDWFDERYYQIRPKAINAFGIEISSRDMRADEIIELIGFSRSCAERKVAHFVKCAFYDSKSNMCQFEVHFSVKDGDAVSCAILESALRNIGQFLWFDTIHQRVNQDCLQFVQLGEEYFRFNSFIQWVNKAASWFRGARLRDGYGYICVDSKGRICQIGKHFIRAKNDNSFPVVVYAIDQE